MMNITKKKLLQIIKEELVEFIKNPIDTQGKYEREPYYEMS